MSRHIFTVKDGKTRLDGQPFLSKGLRFSNSLVSEQATDDLIAHLDFYASCGVNSISVFFQGSRFGDIKGYREDASLDPVYAARMAKIIQAADVHAMLVVVGCLYWSNSTAKWESWTQKEANLAVANTVRWLKENNAQNVLVDVDNEGMALAAKGFDNRLLVLAGKEVNPDCMIATNFHGQPPAEADMGIHHSQVPADGRPYIETEGTPNNAPAFHGYWGDWSKREGLYAYINVGVYTPEMKQRQIETTREHLENGRGYFMASTWLQAAPPQGPHHEPGGQGSEQDPGVLWWLDWLRDTYGPYRPAG